MCRRDGVVQQSGMRCGVSRMQMAKAVQRVVQRHRMATERAKMMLQMVVQHCRRHCAVGTVVIVRHGHGGRRCGRAAGCVRRGAMRGRRWWGAAVNGARQGALAAIAHAGGTQRTWLRTGHHANINLSVRRRHLSTEHAQNSFFHLISIQSISN